ncbi:MAG: LysM peptidoglycan-binding domain-containing protein [Thermoguttaceae bacterium]
MSVYVVKPGDTLSAIARQHGIKSWQELYNDASNTSFRMKRPNPNLIFPGDQINIPDAGRAASAAQDSARFGKFARHKEAMLQELHKNMAAQAQGMTDEEFFRFLEDTKTDWNNAFFLSDRAEDAVKIVNYYKAMKALRLPLSEIKGVVPIITKWNEGDKFLAAIIKPGGKLGTVLGTVGKTGKVVGFVALAVQVYVDVDRHDYYAAAGEVYKTGMGLAIGWAGLIDAAEGFGTAIAGPAKDPRKDERFWKYVKALNIIGLGAAGIDAVGTMIQVMVTKDMDPRRMDRLIERLRSSPAQIFLEMGEDLDKSLTYFQNMPEDEFRKAMSASNFYNFIKYELTGKLP